MALSPAALIATSKQALSSMTGTIASDVTISSGIKMPDFDWNLSSGENRIITFDIVNHLQ